MNRITKALVTAGAAGVLGIGAMVATTTTAEASPISCLQAQLQAEQAFESSQYYLGLGNYFQAAGLQELASYNFGVSRSWAQDWLNIRPC